MTDDQLLPRRNRNAKPSPAGPQELVPKPSTPVINVEDLEDPFVSNPVLTVEGAYRGFGIRHIENFLIVHFDRWTRLGVGDVFEFYMGQRYPVAWDEIKPGDETRSSFSLAIPREQVPEGFVNDCFGRVLRNGSITESTSSKRTWFIKSTRPGGAETVGLDYNDKLRLTLPPDLQAPGAVLDPERAAQGVAMRLEKYANIRVRDIVELYWNSLATLLVTLEIDDEHVAGTKPIEIVVPKSIIDQGGSGLLAHRCRVRDEVINYSGYVHQYSQSVVLEADLDPNLLERPYLLIEGDDSQEYNHDVHRNSLVEVEVFVDRTLPGGGAVPAGTQIEVTLTLTLVDGSTSAQVLPLFPARIGRSAFTDVDNAILKEAIGGSMNITYRLLSSAGVELGRSRGLRVTITGTQTLLPPVDVDENDAGLINPTVRYIKVNIPEFIPYDPYYNVKLVMQAVKPGGGLEEYTEDLLGGGPPPDFRIVTSQQFAPFIGLPKVDIFYRVDFGGEQGELDSARLTVRFGEAMPELPQMIIADVLDDNLDPDQLIGGRAIVRLPYTRAVPGDKILWRLLGSAVGGSIEGEIPISSGNAGRQLSFTVSESVFRTNLNGEMRGTYTLVPGNGSRPLYSEPLIFTVGKALGALNAPEVDEASQHPPQLAPEAVTAGATVRVSFLEMLPSDQIKMVWTGLSELGTHEETKNGNTTKTVLFTVPPEVIGASIRAQGSDIRVQYFLIRGTRNVPSLPLDLRLLAVNLWPQPRIEGVNGDVLYTSLLSGFERTTISLWPFIQPDQRMWMDYTGEYPDGKPYNESTYTANLVTDDELENGAMPPTPVDQLRTLKDGSTLSIEFCVNFARTDERDDAVCFPVTEYTVENTSITPAITEVTDANGKAIAHGSYTTATTLVISGVAAASGILEIYDGDELIDTVTPVAGDTWRITVSDLALRQHTFQARATYGNPRPASNLWVVNTQAKLRQPKITSAYDTFGIYCPPGSVLTRSYGITFYGTCDARPYSRNVGVVTADGSGYGFQIPAGVTSFSRYTNIVYAVGWADWRFVEYEDQTVKSNLWPLYY